MPALLAQAMALEGVWLLGLATVLAGLVRGFTGFGSGLVYMPLAALVLPPAQAVAVLVLMDMIGPLPQIPRALRDGAPRDMIWLGLCHSGRVCFLRQLMGQVSNSWHRRLSWLMCLTNC